MLTDYVNPDNIMSIIAQKCNRKRVLFYVKLKNSLLKKPELCLKQVAILLTESERSKNHLYRALSRNFRNEVASSIQGTKRRKSGA